MATKKHPQKKKKPVTDFRSLRRRWRTWISRMDTEIRDLKRKKQIFWDLQKIAEENKDIFSPGLFFEWMCKNYMVAAAVSLRRFVDHRDDSQSLRLILNQILANPGIISRRSHNALYMGNTRSHDAQYKKHMKKVSNKDFDRFVDEEGNELSQDQIKSDLKIMDKSAKKIHKYVNKKVAHLTSPREHRRSPTLNDLNEAVEDIFGLVGKYSLLLDGHPVQKLPEDKSWKEVLRKPWIKGAE